MIYKIVHYKVRADKLDEVYPAIVEFVGAIRENEPATFYEAYQEPDGLSFVHIMSFPDEATEKNHQTAHHTMKFVEVLYPNCEESPVFKDLQLVNTTGLQSDRNQN